MTGSLAKEDEDVIENVRLLNFLSHVDTTITLPQGICVFVGRNGAGKSSVIDGITYAMYGRHTRGNNENLVRDDSPSGSASVEFTVGTRRFVVERKLNSKGQLEGSVLTELFPAKKGEGGGGDDDHDDADGTADLRESRQIAGGERRQFGESTTAEVAKVVGLDYDSMRIAAIIQQGELAKIVDMRPKETKELINQLIGLDQLGAAHDEMPTLVAAFRQMVRAKYGCDDTALPALVSRTREQEETAATSSQRLLALGKELSDLRGQEAGLAEKLKAMEPLRLQTQLLLQQVETLVNYVTGARSTIERERQKLDQEVTRAARSLALVRDREGPLRQDKASLVAKETENEGRLSVLSVEIATLEAKKDRPSQLEKTIAMARSYLELLSREEAVAERLSSTGGELQDLEARMVALNEEKGRYQVQLELASRLEFRDGICPMCGSRVEKVKETFDKDELTRHLAGHVELLSSLRGQRDKVTKDHDEAGNEARRLVDARKFLADNMIAREEDVAKLAADREELLPKVVALPSLRAEQTERLRTRLSIKGKVQELSGLETQLSIASAYLKEHEVSSDEDIGRLRAAKEKMEVALSRLPANVEALKTERDAGKLSVLSIDDRAKDMLARVASLAEVASRYDPVEFEKTSRDLETLRGVVIANKGGEMATCEANQKRAEKELETLAKDRQLADKAASYVRGLQDIRERVYHRDGPVSGSMRSWALNQIGLKASEYSRLFGIGVSRVVLKEKNRDIAIECYRPRGMVKVESLSGGEKVAVALALRFAMAYVMGGYKLDFVILDEPTVFLDEERRASMVEMISALGGSESPLKQMIIITHDEEIFENANVDALFSFESTSAGTVVNQASRHAPPLQVRG
jgi:DNA repair protein SbcC/Rad50